MSNKINNGALDLLLDAMSGGSVTGAVERQEAREQQRACARAMIARRISENDKAVLERAGVVFSGEGEGDDVLQRVTLPPGWALKPTDHSMWSNLTDEHGAIRAKCFYKGAFYDRDADITITRRFYLDSEHDFDKRDPATHNCPVRLHLRDRRKSEPLRTSAWATYGYNEEHPERADFVAWLDEHYPHHGDASAYWDEAP